MTESTSMSWAMAARQVAAGPWSWFCDGSVSSAGKQACLGDSPCIPFIQLVGNSLWLTTGPLTTCIRDAIVCLAQILLLLAFFLFLAVSNSIPPGALTGTELLQTFEVGSILYNVTALLSGITGLGNVGAAIYVLVTGSISPAHEWLHLLVQGVAWITIAISLRIRLRNPTKQVAYIWWILTFLLASLTLLLSLLDLIRGTTEISVEVYIVIASWPVSCLLLACAVRGERWVALEPSSLSEPLLTSLAPVSKDTTETPSATAGLFSFITFSWLGPLLKIGYQRPLQQRDIPLLDARNQSKTACEAFLEAWELQKKKDPAKTQSVFRALASVYWRSLLRTGFFALGKSLVLASGPLILRLFIDYEAGDILFKYEGYTLVAALFVCKILESIFQRHWYAGSRIVGMRLRSAIVGATYQKQLRLSSLGRQRHAAGEIVNYLAVDAYRLGEFPWYLHQVWTTPLQIVIASVLLFYTLGWATIAGLAIIAITIACNMPLARALQKSQVRLMGAQDDRLRASTEILNSMKIIKLQAWENSFKGKLTELRQHEFHWLSSYLYRRSFGTTLYWMTPVLVSSMTFAAYISLGHKLTPAVVFTSLAAFRIVQEPIRVVPELLAMIIQVQVSLERLRIFLGDDELESDAVNREPSEEYAVDIRDGVLSWDPKALKPTLRDIHLQIKHGDHVAVCGAVGSGKSTLLNSIMGEISKISGTVNVSGSIAYVAQSAWIQGGTIQMNILFGLPMDKARYQSAIKASALDQDINGFPFGDQTEIGERGINMSGGQKQRIQLARAVYSDAGIYLLDDPFSAVDAHTAATLFKDCVMGALKKKTVILVTHQVEFLPAVDLILVMNDGEIVQTGKYDDLLEDGQAFKLLVTAHEEAMGTVSHNGESEELDEAGITNPDEVTSSGAQLLKNLSIARSRRGSRREPEPPAIVMTQLVQQEERETGDTGLKTYLDYIRIAHGWVFFIMGILTQGVFVLGQLAANYWMATRVSDAITSDTVLIVVYSGLSIVSGIFVFLRSRYNVALGLKASKTFFSILITCLFCAPMAFFDSTPMGRILSRISQDMTLLDIDVPLGFGFVSSVSLELLGVIVIIAMVTWQVLIVVIPSLFVVRWLQRYYLTSAKELMRMNGTTKAPIVNNFGETISGAMTIRAFRKTEQFKKKNLQLIDVDSGLFFHTFIAYEWLVLRLETLCAIILCTSALLMILLPPNRVNSGFAGLSLIYGLTLNGVLVFVIQYLCTLANNIVSVERIQQYMHIPSEGPLIIDNCRPSAQWPSEGKVELQHLQIRYRPTAPLVLKGVTCTIKGGQRVGVVGRTGSGKTTLISALFRLVEPSGGRILIDSLDITTIGLHDLRSRLGIIPQEPTLFRGSVRSNLDPLGEHSDREIWEALDKCQLADNIRGMQAKLDAPVSDEGENWSVGQRQLFCLGRALLKHSRILVLDEATASIDTTTDAIIQHLIRVDFCDCTVITVAHRIPTVVDSDMVLALTDGVMAEYDTPLKLLENNNSLFRKLVVEYWKNVQHL